jgi:hypothetical protein
MIDSEARAALSSIPALTGYDGPLERMGGLTNLVFRAGDGCLRIPGQGTERRAGEFTHSTAIVTQPAPASRSSCDRKSLPRGGCGPRFRGRPDRQACVRP